MAQTKQSAAKRSSSSSTRKRGSSNGSKATGTTSRAYLDTGSAEARERISVLNLRHSLSTALVALRATGQAGWTDTVNVNQLLAAELGDAFGWLGHPTFTALLGDPCRSAAAR